MGVFGLKLHARQTRKMLPLLLHELQEAMSQAMPSRNRTLSAVMTFQQQRANVAKDFLVVYVVVRNLEPASVRTGILQGACSSFPSSIALQHSAGVCAHILPAPVFSKRSFLCLTCGGDVMPKHTLGRPTLHPSTSRKKRFAWSELNLGSI